ncbi:MAG: hypothetical protein WHT29_09340 [Bacteroidales bacterium]
MRIYLTFILIVFPFILWGQVIHNNIEGFWMQEKNELQESHDSTSGEETIYKYYTGELVIWIWFYERTSQIEIYKTIFGFYNDCDLPRLDSLKREGTYYFELDYTDFDNEKTIKTITHQECAELNIYTHERDTLMTIYYSIRQQFVTYKKINALPEMVMKYLKEKGIEIKK